MFKKEIMFKDGYIEEYNRDCGYGSVAVRDIQEKNRTDSEAAIRCGGWNVRRLLDDQATDAIRDVSVYRVDVPEFGTYRLNVTITAEKEDVENLFLFAGRRNLIDHGISIRRGKEYSRSFYQAVTPYIPALCSQRSDDKCIFISVTGGRCSVSLEVTREDVPIIWVAGDSTLTDQNAGIPYYPFGSCAGWAQTLQRFVEGAAVCNLAHSGMTTNCFRDDGHYDIVKEMIKPGDIFIMQFGHNDQKRRNLAAFGGYAENLRRYVKEIREFGAIPIICSPISRIPDRLSLDGESYYSVLASHAKACRHVAQELNVTFVDLHEKTFNKWTRDMKAAHDYFMPGDITHTNEYGAVLISGYFMETMKNMPLFSNHREFAALLPDMDTKVLPKELPGPDIFGLKPPYVDIEGISEYDGIKKAYSYGLLDPCVMHLHPYAPMPRAQLLMLLFRAFGKTGARPYIGIFEDISFDEWDAGYVQALINMGIADVKERRFRPDEPLTYEEFEGYTTAFARMERLEVSHVFKRADRINSGAEEPYGIAKDDEITRAEVYMTLANIMEMRGQVAKSAPADAEVHPVH